MSQDDLSSAIDALEQELGSPLEVLPSVVAKEAPPKPPPTSPKSRRAPSKKKPPAPNAAEVYEEAGGALALIGQFVGVRYCDVLGGILIEEAPATAQACAQVAAKHPAFARIFSAGDNVDIVLLVIQLAKLGKRVTDHLEEHHGKRFGVRGRRTENVPSASEAGKRRIQDLPSESHS